MCWKRKTLEVTVCAASKMLPNPYCINLEKRKFYVSPKPGEALPPTKCCTLHFAPEPPPVEPEPTVRTFVGVYDLLGATGDIDTFLDKCVTAGAAGVRFFVCYSWNGPQTGGSPYTLVGQWTHDNGIAFDLYRLSEWDEGFWTRFDNLLAKLKCRKLTAWVVVEDFCSLKGDSRTKYYNPFYCSEEALGPSTPGGIWGDAMKLYHAALIGRTIDHLNSSRVRYLIEPMNEYDAIEYDDSFMVAWHGWAVATMFSAGDVPVSQIVGTAGRCGAAIASQVGLWSPHGIGRPDQIVEPLGIAAWKVVFSSDGFFTGAGGADAKGRRGVGVDVAAEIGRRIITLGAWGFELLPREVYGANNDRADVDRFDAAPIKEMSYSD